MSSTENLGEDGLETIPVMYTSSSLARVLGIKAALGRLFRADEDTALVDTVVLSHEMWLSDFGGRPDVIGRQIMLAATPSSRPTKRTIVGVLEPGFEWAGEKPAVLLPIGLMSYNGKFETNRFLRLVGRVSQSVLVEQVADRVIPFVRRDEAPTRRSARVATLLNDRIGESRPHVLTVVTCTGMLFVVALAAAAGIVINDARARHREDRIRLALGAAWHRVLRSRMIEYAAIGAAGAVVGAVLSVWLLPAVIAAGPTLPSGDTVTFDQRAIVALLICGAVAAVSLAIVGGVASRIGRRESASLEIRGGHSRSAKGLRITVITQMSLALSLVVVAALFGQSAVRLREVPLGFDPDGVVVADVKLVPEAARISTPRGPSHLPVPGPSVFAPLVEELQALPGVSSAAIATSAPFGRLAVTVRVSALGLPPESELLAQRVFATDQFFQTLGIQANAGRLFEPSDRYRSLVAVVSQTMADRLLPDFPRSRVLTMGTASYEVIGVVNDLRQASMREDAAPVFYTLDMNAAGTSHVLVRTRGGEVGAMTSVTAVINRAAAGLRVTNVALLSRRVETSMAGEAFRALLSAGIGALALALSALGLFGFMTRTIVERMHELALRMALGASPGQIRALIVRDTVRIVVVAAAVGLPTAVLSAQVVRSLLFGVGPQSPYLLIASIVVLAAVALTAAVVPAVRAGRVAPADALRNS